MLSIIIPTLSGREESLDRCIRAYEQHTDVPFELIVVQDQPTWPTACNIGYRHARFDILHFTADDLEPLPGWLSEALPWLQANDELPAPRVMNFSADGEWDNREDGENYETTWFTRIPLLRRDQYERIGSWPEYNYVADVWLSEKARTIGIETRIFWTYAFVHHWSQIGRVPYDDAARATMQLLRRQM